MSISLHDLLSSKSFLQIQIGLVLITLLQRKSPNFNALLPILCVGPNTIKYTFNLKLSEKSFFFLESVQLV